MNREWHREYARKYHLSHKSERAALSKQWAQGHKALINAASKRWRVAHPQHSAFFHLRDSAKRRGIAFRLTLEEFILFWGDLFRSGDDLCACRYGDEGAYEMENMYIASRAENTAGPRVKP